MADLYLLHFNNYYNRQVKKFDTLEEYLPFVINPIRNNINFIPNDYVNTTQVINNISDDQVPDYLLVVESGVIKSRWYVVESVKNSYNQMTLTLHRDVVADYWNIIIESPIFIEKATLQDNDPGIFNKEDMTFNQILKTSETLKDKTNCPWLVGYVARNASTFNNLDIDYDTAIVSDYIVNDKTQLPFYKYLDKTYTDFNDIAIDVIFATDNSSTLVFNSFNRYGEAIVPARSKSSTITKGFNWVTKETSEDNRLGYFQQMLNCIGKTPISTKYMISIGTYANRYFANYMKDAIPLTTWNTISSQLKSYTGTDGIDQINQYVGKVCIIDGKYYRVVLETTTTDENKYSSPTDGYKIPVVDNIIRDAYNRAIENYAFDYPELASQMTSNVETGSTSSSFICTIRTSNAGTATLSLEEIKDTKITAKLTTSNSHVHLNDAPYDMFCMPYSNDLRIVTKSGSETLEIISSKELSFAVMNAIARQGVGANKVHDIQLLPYCPLQQFVLSNGKLDLTQSSTIPESLEQYYYVTDESGVGKLGVFIYCSSSTGTFNIEKNIPVTDYKIQALCDKYRLCSPNYSSIFEFNAAYNRGVERFNIDFNYKPYSPYIHINPNFKSTGLYGQDQDDPRGLICGGDFSITLISDAWETYQLQNKNYQLSFQRQIENMEINNAVQREREIWAGAAGSISGGISGAVTGGIIGGPAGAIAGGLIGGAASIGGGIRDYALNQKLRNEALDYTKDQFGYNLQNIQALPNTIAKVGTFNRNNKLFPVLEYYTCTDMEKQALRDKIKYNGMTVMRIGKIIDYIQTTQSYIKGKLIRLEGINEDFHLVNTIADEIYKGVFI